MRAVRWHGRGDVRLDAIPAARGPGPGEIRLRVAWCGLCGSDVHEYRSGPFAISRSVDPLTGRPAPVVLGHEVSGWITDVGPEVDHLGVDDLVVLNALLPCGRCAWCARGDLHLCRALGHIGLTVDGGLADALTVPAAMAVPVPRGVDAELAALGEPFAVAVHAVRQAGQPVGLNCIVVGAGAIGLAAALVLRAAKNSVTVLDVARPRLEHARRLGLAARRADRRRRQRVPVVMECSGTAQGLAEAVMHADSGGTVVLAGLPEGPVPVDIADLVRREVRLVGTMSHLSDLDLVPALDLLAEFAGEARELITDRIALEETVSRGLGVLAGKGGAAHAKILVRVRDAV